VKENNALQEGWDARPDSTAQWSHCAVVPLYVLFQDIAGIRTTAPGFTRLQIRPQLADLPDLDLTAHTPQGPIGFVAQRTSDGHRVSVTLPPHCQAELLLPQGCEPGLPALSPDHPLSLKRYTLPPGQSTTFPLTAAGVQ
jgi:hypothetical protein